MALSVETRAARLVAALEPAGKRVGSLTITGDEIKITFVEDGNIDTLASRLIDWRKPNSTKG